MANLISCLGLSDTDCRDTAHTGPVDSVHVHTTPRSHDTSVAPPLGDSDHGTAGTVVLTTAGQPSSLTIQYCRTVGSHGCYTSTELAFTDTGFVQPVSTRHIATLTALTSTQTDTGPRIPVTLQAPPASDWVVGKDLSTVLDLAQRYSIGFGATGSIAHYHSPFRAGVTVTSSDDLASDPVAMILPILPFQI